MDLKGRARLERMMEYGEGMQPSARCVRISKHNNRSSSGIATTDGSNIHKSDDHSPKSDGIDDESGKVFSRNPPWNTSTGSTSSEDAQQTEQQKQPSIIVKDFIVERHYSTTSTINTPGRNISIETRSKKTMNCLGSSQQFATKSISSTTTKNGGGFPSYHSNFPVGTLARRREPLPTINSYSNNKALSSKISSVTATNNNNNNNSSTNNKILSSADTIINNMSKDEINEYLQQIHSSLSADKIAFLRQRGCNKNKVHPNSATAITTTTGVEIDNNQHNMNHDEHKDLEFYQQLSNIQTPEDLDKVFHKYQSSTIEEFKLQQILQNYSINTSSTTASTNQNTNKCNNGDYFYFKGKNHNPDEDTTKEVSVNDWQEEQLEDEEKELEYGTNLLRSSSYRQRLVGSRMVSNLLRKQLQRIVNQRKNNTEEQVVPKIIQRWPIYLPVSLRCLLDDTTSSSRKRTYQSIIMNSNVLESTYSLLLLFSHKELTTTTTTTLQDNDISIYHQLYYMNDAVPTSENMYPSSSISSMKASIDNDNNKTVMVYSTNTNFSAESDGLAFYNDPLWTLLSRMQIIPCIVKLILFYTDAITTTSTIDEVFRYYSRQSLVCICHILSLLSLRTPGAASAIVDHKYILPLIIKVALPLTASSSSDSIISSAAKEVDGLSFFDPHIALPFLKLIVTLGRQSRHVAARLSTSYIDHLQAALAVKAETDFEWTVQKLCLVAWRTFLRYGLAISYSSILVNLGASSMKWQDASEHSLLPEYLSTFAELCHCASIAKYHASSSSSIGISHQLTFKENEAIGMSGMWIAPTVQHIIAVLSTNYLWREKNDFLSNSRESLSSTADMFKTISSMLNLLSSYYNASNPIVASLLNAVHVKESDARIEHDFHHLLSVEVTLSVLQSVVDSASIGKAVSVVLTNTFHDTTIEHNAAIHAGWLKVEASCCSLIVAFLSLTDSLRRMIICDKMKLRDGTLQQYINFCLQVKDIVIDQYNILGRDEQNEKRTLDEHHSSQPVRDSWLNHANFSMIMFLCNLCDDSLLTQGSSLDRDSIFHFIRPVSFCLLGRLHRGEEYFALILLRQNALFQLTGDQKEASQLQKMLLRHLCDSELSCAQLAHSTNVHLPTDSPGRFVLASLRSDAENFVRGFTQQQHKVDEEATVDLTSPLLPLGPLWLLHVLSSTVVLYQNSNRFLSSTHYVEESTLILISTLEMLLYMEQQSMISDKCAKYSLYTGRIPSGEKLYHLCNICLFPDGALDSQVQHLFSRLFTIYTASNKQKNFRDVVRAFGEACFFHSQRDLKHGDHKKNLQNSKKNVAKSLLEFATDLCTTFLAYGAQYDVFILCIRFLMRPDFPTEVVSHVILQMQDNWHLLTTTEEEIANCQGDKIIRVVEDGLRGGLPSLDGSPADPPLILSAYSAVLKSYRGRLYIPVPCQGITPSCGGVFYAIAVATIARNFALTGDLSVLAVQKRYGKFSQETAVHILEVAKCILDTVKGTKHDLSQIALQVCCTCNKDSPKFSGYLGEGR